MNLGKKDKGTTLCSDQSGFNNETVNKNGCIKSSEIAAMERQGPDPKRKAKPIEGDWGMGGGNYSATRNDGLNIIRLIFFPLYVANTDFIFVSIPHITIST